MKKRTKKYKKPVKFKCVRNTEEMVKHESGHALSQVLFLCVTDNLDLADDLVIQIAFDKQLGKGSAVIGSAAVASDNETAQLTDEETAFGAVCVGPSGALALCDQPTALMFCYDKDITKLRTASERDHDCFLEGMDDINPLNLPMAQTIWIAVQFLMEKHYSDLFAGYEDIGHETETYSIAVKEFVQRHESLLKYAMEYGAAFVEAINKAKYEVENGITTPKPKAEAVLQ